MIDKWLQLKDEMKLQSWKQAEVSYWVAQGLSNKEISEKIGISLKGVKERLRTVFRFLKIKSRLELILLVGEAEKNIRVRKELYQMKEKEHEIENEQNRLGSSTESLPRGRVCK